MRRIPVQDIQFNTTTTPQPKTPHVGVVARAVIGIIAALVLLAAVILGFIWYRRRYNIRRSWAFSSDVMEPASGIDVTPFVPNRPEMTHGNPMTRTVWQQPHSGLSATVATDGDAHDPYSSPSGLHSQLPTSVPVGLSDKELARMRAENLPSRPASIDAITVNLLGDANGSQYPSFPAPATEPRGSPTSVPLFRTLQSQVDRLWREMRQLRAERLGSEAPPSYAEQDASQHGGRVQS